MLKSSHIYHLVEKARWKAATTEGYLPPTYAQDGFVHATREMNLLLPVANHFYTDVPGEFLCLRIDMELLISEVKFEAAAPVGDKAAHSEKEEGGDSERLVFPHIYGPINREAVVAELTVARSGEGKFLSIESLC